MKEKMTKESILKVVNKAIKTKIGVGVLTGATVFIVMWGYHSMSKSIILDGAAEMKEKYIAEIEQLNKDLENKGKKLEENTNKIKQVSTYFTLSESDQELATSYMNDLKNKADEVKKAEEERLRTEQETKRKAEEEAKKKVEEVEKAKGVDTFSVQSTMNSLIQGEISENKNITNTKLNRLTVNENLGTDDNKDVVVLGYLSWSTKNTEKMTREMLKMYSEHFAATIAPSLANGSEIALFWDAEYTGLSIKHSYYVKDGKAYMQ